jgi:hypothetical protein
LRGTSTIATPTANVGSVYKPGERGWLKVKNKADWKYAVEREAVFERATTRFATRAERHARGSRRLDLRQSGRIPTNHAS